MKKTKLYKEICDTSHLFQLILRATESTPNIQNLHIKPKLLLEKNKLDISGINNYLFK